MNKRRELFEEWCLTLDFLETLTSESRGILLITIRLIFGVAISPLAEVHRSERSHIPLIDLCLRKFHYEEVSRIHPIIYSDPYFGHIIDYLISPPIVDTLSSFDQIQQI